MVRTLDDRRYRQATPTTQSAQPFASSTARDQRAWAASAAARSEAGSKRRSRVQVWRRSSVEDQTPTPRPAKNAAPRPVVSTTFGRSTGTPTWSACSWHSRSLAAAPPSTRSEDELRHHVEHVAHLEGDRLQRRADDVGAGGAAGEADDQAARLRVPVRRAEPGQGRHEDDAVAVGDRRRDRLALGRGADDLDAVAQPLHGRAGDEDRALGGVGDLAVGGAPGRRGEQRVGALDGRAGVGEHERPGAVGALRVALVEAGLAEERRLLVAREPGDRQRQAEERLRVGRRDLAPVGHQLGQRVARDAEEPAQLVGPVARLEVEEQRPGRVGDVGDVVGPAGHPGDQVGVDGADRVAAGLDQRPGVRLVLGQPHQLGAGEVRVEPQPGQLAHPVLVAVGAQPVAEVRRTPVLPDDRAARRPERLAVPEQHGLALVGDADRLQRVGVGGLRARRGWPRASPARSPRARARPSRASGSAARTPGSPAPRSARRARRRAR